MEISEWPLVVFNKNGVDIKRSVRRRRNIHDKNIPGSALSRANASVCWVQNDDGIDEVNVVRDLVVENMCVHC